MTVVDWESKPEPWRSIGLRFVDEIAGIGEGPPAAPSRRPDLMAFVVPGSTPAAKLRNLRLKRRLSSEGLAARSGLSRRTIYLAEKGLGPGRAENKAKIAAVLGVEISDIW